MKHAMNWLATMVACVVFFGAQALEATPDNLETRTAQIVADDAEHAQLLAEVDARIALRAHAVCLEVAGPGASAGWTPAGELVCQPATRGGAQ